MAKRLRALAGLLSALLCLGLFLPIRVSAAGLYFTALNDRISELSSDTMPFWSGGLLYVPYTVFDASKNGVDVYLGTYASYAVNDNKVTIYNTQRMLTFDLAAGTCYDELTGASYSARAIMRNGKPFLPAETVCSFFPGLRVSCRTIPYISQGYMVRITNADAVLDDTTFIDSAGITLDSRLKAYTQSLNPAETTNPGGEQGLPQPDEPATSTYIPTYLAVLCRDGEGLSSILATLDGRGEYAVFFLTPELIGQQGDLVRRMLGTGHSVGILAEGNSALQSRQLLEQGNLALEELARTRTTLAYVPQGQRAALEEAGWVCWRETLSLSPSDTVAPTAFANSTLSRLSGRQLTTFLTLTGGDGGARVLPTLLRRLEQEHFTLSIPMETRL